MIYDDLTNSALYPQNDLFKQAFEFLKTLGPDSPLGKTVLQGDDLFVGINEYSTKTRDIAKLETHRNYIDIQVLLSGTEQIELYSAAKLTTSDPYDAARDIEFYERPTVPEAMITLEPGKFAVFFPDDAHMPCLALNGDSQPVKKAVVKLRVDLLR